MLKQYAIGGGVTLLPEFMLYEEDRDRLALHHFSHPYFNRTETYMMTRRGRQLPPAAQKIISDDFKDVSIEPSGRSVVGS